MPEDDRTFITVHDGMPEHPKIVGLSDAAFRRVVELWCYSSRTKVDGFIPRAEWMKSRPRVRRELLEPVPGWLPLFVDHGARGVEAHDYLKHNRSAEQIARAMDQKSRAGAKGNHRRHHAGPGGTPLASCPECVAEGLAERSQVRQQPRSQNGRGSVAGPVANGSHIGRKSVADPEESLRDSQTETDPDLPEETSGGDRPESNASASATPPQRLLDQQKHDQQPCGDRHDPALACWRCRDARKVNRDGEDQAVLAEATRRDADARRREQCQACDVNGWLEHPESGVPVVRCDHETDPRKQLADALDHVS